jgi:hypothetical protein
MEQSNMTIQRYDVVGEDLALEPENGIGMEQHVRVGNAEVCSAESDVVPFDENDETQFMTLYCNLEGNSNWSVILGHDALLKIKRALETGKSFD